MRQDQPPGGSGGGSGTITGGTNLGASGSSVFSGVSGATMEFRKLIAGTSVTIVENLNDITISASGAGSGDVAGPASSTDNAIARFDGTTGKIIQNSAASIADTTGDITAGKYNTVAISGSSTPTLAVTGSAAISGTNTGDQTNITGNAATVTTNANLTGPITSVGNATSVASQTGTGSTFAMSASPTFTGSPAAPTQTAGDNSTKLATTAYVDTGLALKQGLNTKLTDLAGLSYTGNSLKVIRVNAGETGFELATPSGGGGGSTTEVYAYTAKTSNYTVTTSDYLINCTSGTFTVTLPTAVGIQGQSFYIKNSGTGIITVATTSSQTIDGVTTQVMPTQYAGIKVTSDGANWLITEG